MDQGMEYYMYVMRGVSCWRERKLGELFKSRLQQDFHDDQSSDRSRESFFVSYGAFASQNCCLLVQTGRPCENALQWGVVCLLLKKHFMNTLVVTSKDAVTCAVLGLSWSLIILPRLWFEGSNIPWPQLSKEHSRPGKSGCYGKERVKKGRKFHTGRGEIRFGVVGFSLSLFSLLLSSHSFDYLKNCLKTLVIPAFSAAANWARISGVDLSPSPLQGEKD